ncbi:MAG: ClbS/DfsB family four-helix bundle protein [Ardenticatenaceae bacterium]|nr:ClbS/DfsB family four-helix bundle protein [Ardenticatenaceae bacterium]MCB9443682.1 ClbS/DfsB family four-helix bundle protein [Ardenticatenaceae bacterium]
MMEGVLAILDQLDSSRERVLTAIEMLPDEALVEAGAVGKYSVADLLALQAAWEAELVTGLMRLNQRKKPEQLLAALARPDVYDAERYTEFAGRDLDLIFDDLQQVRMQLETWLEEFSERDLMGRNRYEWFGGKSLKQVILGVCTEQEAAYVADLERFSQQWLDEHEDEEDVEPDHFIPLTAVLPEVDDDEQPD